MALCSSQSARLHPLKYGVLTLALAIFTTLSSITLGSQGQVNQAERGAVVFASFQRSVASLRGNITKSNFNLRERNEVESALDSISRSVHFIREVATARAKVRIP